MPIKPDLPPHPEFGVPLPPTHESPDTLRLLALRRSTPVAALTGPGPSAEDLNPILRLAMRVPDHRKLEPWRILIIEGEARNKLGDYFAAALHLRNPDATPDQLEAERKHPLRAPVILAVIYAPNHHHPKNTPVWEQQLSSGALCQNILIASSALGWAASWITETPAYDSHVHAALGMAPGEQVSGFIYLGTAKDHPVERQRPDVSKKATRWTGA
jgi:nitroreductase